MAAAMRINVSNKYEQISNINKQQFKSFDFPLKSSSDESHTDTNSPISI